MRSTARTSDRYERSTCAQELIFRNAIARNINEGRAPVWPLSAPSIRVVSPPRGPMRGLAIPDERAEKETEVITAHTSELASPVESVETDNEVSTSPSSSRPQRELPSPITNAV